ncbi:hypothetical protein BDV11DRAFT_194065 [Aspergillus similis]
MIPVLHSWSLTRTLPTFTKASQCSTAQSPPTIMIYVLTIYKCTLYSVLMSRPGPTLLCRHRALRERPVVVRNTGRAAVPGDEHRYPESPVCTLLRTYGVVLRCHVMGSASNQIISLPTRPSTRLTIFRSWVRYVNFGQAYRKKLAFLAALQASGCLMEVHVLLRLHDRAVR